MPSREHAQESLISSRRLRRLLGSLLGSFAAPAQPAASLPRPSASRTGNKNAEGKFIGRRKVKPKLLAVINDGCTGCAGAPVCQIYCPVDDCMLLQPAGEAGPYGRIWVDPLKCVGCRKCVSRGPESILLDGCPWNAIDMVPTTEWEAMHGVLAY